MRDEGGEYRGVRPEPSAESHEGGREKRNRVESIAGANGLALVLQAVSRRRVSWDDGTSPVGASSQVKRAVSTIVSGAQRGEDEGADGETSCSRREQGRNLCNRETMAVDTNRAFNQ